MSAEIHVGDVGTAFEATIKNEAGQIVTLPTSGATLQMVFKNRLARFVKPAVLATDGSDGKIRYVTQPSDLNVAGAWQVQGLVAIPGGSWSSDIHHFDVKGNI
jgi:hypothetical protein